jgi:tRNA threonylcarbamoyladenosine biosynthesis protein TsaE
MKEIITNNFRDTQALGKNFAKEIFKREKKKKSAVIIALEGDLGAGKTTFAQGMAEGLGVKEQITSPTFVLIKKYPIRFQVSRLPKPGTGGQASFKFQDFYHIDCYRLDKPWQLQELGFEEIINNPENIVAMEWAEKISEILPEDKITIKFEWVDENKRKIIF